MIAFSSHCGRARLTVVAGPYESPAILTTVTAIAVDGSGEPFLRFSGATVFDAATQEHIRSVIGNLLDRLCRSLGITDRAVEIGISNVGAAAQQEIGLTLSGFSADVPILLASLCALLGLPSPMSVVATGHIASLAGDVANVRGIPAKVAAAQTDPDVKTFVCPSQDRDGSIGELTPDYQRRAMIALDEARSHLSVVAINDVADLADHVFDPDDLVRSALSRGYFEEQVPNSIKTSPADRLADLLLRDGPHRFWKALERWFQAGKIEDARELLYYYCAHYIRQERFPEHFGRRLHTLLASLAPAIRRLRILYPLVSLETFLRLARFGGPSQQEDTRLLFRATQEGVAVKSPVQTTTSDSRSESIELEADQDVGAVLAEISAENLARKVGRPIDDARASFVLDSVQSESNETTLDLLASFYLHLERACHEIPIHVAPGKMMAEAIVLAEESFRNEGGMDALQAEARDATRGGLRFVLDQLAAEYRRKHQLMHANSVLTQALSSRPFEARVAFVRALMGRLGPLLPDELRMLPAERLARSPAKIVNELVKSFDDFKRLLRTL